MNASARIDGPPSRAKLLLVDDDSNVISALARILAPVGNCHFALNGPDALSIAEQLRPDLILLDINMGEMSGLEVCRQLKANPVLTHIPILFVTGRDDEEHEVKCLELGAVDFITKPPRAAQVLARVRTRLEMKRMADELRGQATTDPLTGLANRRVWDESIAREWSRALRTRSPLSLLMVDVDHFKAYNDHYGHPAGDTCLQGVALALKAATHRPSDLLARYGGEEFAALLPETPAAGAERVASRMLAAVEAANIEHARSSMLHRVSVSIGVATFEPMRDLASHESLTSGGQLLKLADESLYAAKQNGRNRSVSATLELPRMKVCL